MGDRLAGVARPVGPAGGEIVVGAILLEVDRGLTRTVTRALRF
jgi:hypothetical protein